jgi:hypothetical protein
MQSGLFSEERTLTMISNELPKAVLYVSGIGATLGMTEVPMLKDLSTLLQFGAFGLCALMMYGMFELIKIHQKERAELVRSLERKESEKEAITEKVAKAINNIAEALKDRKCVAGDSRIKVDE